MGVLRLLLALSVVLAHAPSLWGFKMVGGPVAVQAFFMISGFYMALILNEKYTFAGGVRLFALNRFLRLFPVYWVVLLGTVAVSFAVFHFFGDGLRLRAWLTEGDALSTGAAFFVALTNLSLVGQEVVMFLEPAVDGSLAFTPDFSQSATPLHHFLVVPQAWSLGVELMFYLVAPFLVRRHAGLVLAVAAASFSARFWAYSQFDIAHDPWTYRFFPFEIGFFLLGSLGWRVYAALKNRPLPDWLLTGTWAVVLLYTLGYQWLPGEASALTVKMWVYYALVATAIPLLFIKTRQNRRDRFIGELSYPVYICHVSVIAVMSGAFSVLGIVGETWLAAACVAATLGVSLGLELFVSTPVETLRQRLVKRRQIKKEPVATAALETQNA